MPLIPKAPARSDKESIPVRLDRALHDQLRAYAELVEGSKDYVIAAALERLFKADREFIALQQQQQQQSQRPQPQPQPEDGQPPLADPRSQHHDPRPHQPHDSCAPAPAPLAREQPAPTVPSQSAQLRQPSDSKGPARGPRLEPDGPGRVRA